jgi:hypothetical protein
MRLAVVLVLLAAQSSPAQTCEKPFEIGRLVTLRTEDLRLDRHLPISKKQMKIFDVKESIGKIFRTKDLASTASVLWGHAQRFSLVYTVGQAQGRSSQFRVMDERWR